MGLETSVFRSEECELVGRALKVFSSYYQNYVKKVSSKSKILKSTYRLHMGEQVVSRDVGGTTLRAVTSTCN